MCSDAQPRPTARVLAFTITLLATLAACGQREGDGPTDPPAALAPTLRRLVAGLQEPVHLTAPAGDDRLFVVVQPGRIRVVRDGGLLPEPFLDLTDRVGAGGERGLLSMAFDPDYETNGRFYVDYTDKGVDAAGELYVLATDGTVWRMEAGGNG